MGAKRDEERELERVLGLGPTLAIGVGTMVGAGVFLFPGMAGAQAGPAAVLSFAGGGVIALLVAVCTAELATAMPESGGAYHFASRTFGPFLGTLVGLAQVVGLAFASAFYLVGFGRYVEDALRRADLSLGEPGVLVAVGTALALTALNLFGAERAGGLQRNVVVALAAILTVLFGYGVLATTGVVGQAAPERPFAPNGAAPVFTTAALVFTSFLGFLQIATVAGEVREPSRNLPRALIGSVVVVTLLYVAVTFVTTRLFSPGELGSLGESAVVRVARELVGAAGGLGVLAAGLLATLSSANASILSASRSLYALGNDGCVPGALGRVSSRFKTPYAALLTVGLPIAALVTLERLELLAEIASTLHLFIYGLVCIALVVLRFRKPDWYTPGFRVPAGRAVAAVGALASFGLIAFMEPLSWLLSGVVVALAAGWHLLRARVRA